MHVAAGTVTGTRTAQIVAAPGPGGGPIVRIFDPAMDYASIRDFSAYDPSFRGGVFVAAGDVNGDGAADVVTGAGPGGGPYVQVFDGRSGMALMSFMAYDARFSGGAQVTTADLDGDGIAEIVTGAGSTGGPHVKVINGRTRLSVSGWAGSFFAFHWNYRGGVSVAGYAPRRGMPAMPVLAFAPEMPR